MGIGTIWRVRRVGRALVQGNLGNGTLYLHGEALGVLFGVGP